jgi:hypothetical protein
LAIRQFVNLDVKKLKAGLASGLYDDEVYTPSPRRSEGRRDQLGALSEPRRKQNLSANPKRTAKSVHTNQTARNEKGSKKN